MTAYTSARFEILFDLWAPGRDQLTVTYLLCGDCGLVVYTPRPTAREIAAKYARLGGATSSTVANPVAVPIDRRRSREMLEHLTPYLPARASILDFGGGTGSLMCAFLDAGHACAVVDYAPQAIPGVERLADSLGDLDGGRRFDLITASHVVEHVADPVETVRSLAARLTPGGRLYLEVPLELVGGPPRRSDPVTHINFFSEPSVLALLRRAGYRPLACDTAATLHAGGRRELAIRAVAEVADDGAEASPAPGEPSVDAVRALLRLGPLGLAAFHLRYPTRALNLLRRWRAKRGW